MHRPTRFLLLAMFVFFGSVPAHALTKTYTVPFNSSWITSGWGCGSALPILRNGSYTTAFNSTVPLGSTITNVTITLPMRRAGIFYASGDSDPVVTASMEGQPIGGANIVAGYLACPYTTDLMPRITSMAATP